MVENWNISENRGGPEVFLEIASIAQFLSEIKKEGIKLFRRAIPFYPDPQKIGIHHIRGGGGASIFRLPLKNCSYENWRARPHLMWWIPIFWYLDRRRLLFWTIWCLLFWNRRKIERLTQFPKKLPPPPLIFRYIPVFHHLRLFFWNCINRSIFVRYQKRGHQIVRKSNPLLSRYQNNW